MTQKLTYFLQLLPKIDEIRPISVRPAGTGEGIVAKRTIIATVREWPFGLRWCRGRCRDIGLEPMARAVDGETLFVQQVADAANQEHFVVLVVAAIAAPLDRLQLRELLLPIAEHVRLDRTQITYLADGEIPLGGDWWKFGLSSAVIRHGSQLRPWP